MSRAEPSRFGSLLKSLREAAGFTQDELATISGLSNNAISALERGERRRPQPETVRVLAAALDLSGPKKDALFAAARPAPVTAAAPFAEAPLPWPSTQLVGREEDVAQVVEMLAQPAVRLVTLVGPGGVGKTRLAIESARRLHTSLALSPLFVALAAVRDLSGLTAAIAEAFGLTDAGARDLPAALAAVSAQRSLLLILDNFEQVLDGSPLVASLVEASAELTVLVTSRAPLHLRGEREYIVRPLAMPESGTGASAAAAVQAPAVRLLVERIRDVQGSFRVTDANIGALIGICRRLDALPLALELAGGALKAMTPSQLIDRLERDVPAPIAGARDLPARQQTMRAAVSWSYELLSPPEQEWLRRLAVLPGTITFDAASGLGEGDVLEALASLLDKSLLSRADDLVADRASYQMLETVRAFALSKLDESGERDDAMERLVRYSIGRAVATGAGLDGSAQGEWLERAHEDLGIHREVMAWLFARQQHDEAAAVAWPLLIFFMIRGRTTEGLAWYERLLSAGALEPATEARACVGAALMRYMRREFDRALALLDRAQPLADAADDVDALGTLLSVRGYVAFGVGDVEGVRRSLGRMLSLSGRLPHRYGWLHGSALNGLAGASLMAGDAAGAARLLSEAEVILRQTRCWWPLSVTLNLRATLAILDGCADEAFAAARESLEIIRELRDVFSLIHSLLMIAAAAELRGDDVYAVRLLGALDSMATTAGMTTADGLSYEVRQRTERALRTRMKSSLFDEAYREGGQAEIEPLLDGVRTRLEPR